MAKIVGGICTSHIPAIGNAIARGLDTRIGLEDTFTLPEGAQARDNPALVAAARDRAVRAGRLSG